MKKDKPTSSAQEIREIQFQKFFKRIKDKIIGRKDDFGALNLYRTLLLLIDRQLYLSRSYIDSDELPEISWKDRVIVYRFFCEVARDVKKFQHTEKEGKSLFASLLTWVTEEITGPHYAALREEQNQFPKRVYVGKNAIDPVPFE